jgi:hypothetical protein
MTRRVSPSRATKRFYRRIRRLGKKRGLRAPKAQLKTYNYKFRLAPQLVNASQTVANDVVLNTNSPQVPIVPGLSGFTALSSSTGVAGIADWSCACTHQLSDIAFVSNYTQLYDAYKINSVTATLEYLSNAAAVNGAGIIPTFYMYWDQDDAVPPPTVANILGKAGSRRWQPTTNKMTKSFTYVPVTGNFVIATGGTGSLPAVVPNKSQWIDCTNNNIPHYALKIYCQDFLAPGIASALNMVRIHFTYNVSFRSPLRLS